MSRKKRKERRPNEAQSGRRRPVPRRLSTALMLVAIVGAITFILLSRWLPSREQTRGEPPEGAPAVSLDPNDPTAHWPPRYRENPSLMVIEQYALDVIGEMPPQMQQLMQDMTQRLFGKSGDWHAAVRDAFGWSPKIDDLIREKWAVYQGQAADAGIPPDSLDFARQFADAVDKAMEKVMEERARDAGR